MSEYLVLRLGRERTDKISWLVWSTSEAEVISSGELAHADDLQQLHERAGERKVIALVPTSEICVHQVMMPEKVSRHTLGALPFLMEDDLAQDIEQLHFVPLLEKPKGGAMLPVLVVAKSKLADWLGWLQDADIHADKMLPDALCLPINEERTTVMQFDGELLLRHGSWQLLHLESDWLDIGLDGLKSEAITRWQSLTALDFELNDDFDVEHAPVELPMATLSEQAIANKPNMLTGPYRPRRRRSGKWQIWQLAAMLAGATLLLSVMGKGLELWQLSAQNDALKAAIEQTYSQAFPNSRIVNVRTQLRAQLRKMQGGGENEPLLSMLDELVPAFQKIDGVKPISLKFDGKRKEIRLQATATSFQQFEQFKLAIQELNMEIDQGALSQQDDEVVGTLSIRRAS